MSDNLHFPTIKTSPPAPVLSMDAYVEFVDFCVQYASNPSLREKHWKEDRERNFVPFSLAKK
jgi:hypothetical protein